MGFKFYESVSDVKELDHVWVFVSDKSNILTSDSARIARSIYGRTLNNADGFEQTVNGSTYGVIVREANRFSLVDYEELNHNFVILFAKANLDKDKVYVLPNFLINVLHRQQEAVQLMIREVFLKTPDKSKFILPASWKKTFKLQ